MQGDPEAHVHLCLTCPKTFATCDGKPEFGKCVGNDNVIECSGYVLVAVRLIKLKRVWADVLGDAQDMVKEFHKAFNHPIGEKPRMLVGNALERRIDWMREEINELEDSCNMIDDLDALADLLYFTLGFFVEMGIDASVIFKIVHEANMAKLREGQIEYYPNGKVKKPDDWVSPEGKIKKYLKGLGVPERILTLDEKGEYEYGYK